MYIKLTVALQKRPKSRINLLCCWNDVPTYGDLSVQMNAICNRTGVTDDWRVDVALLDG